MEKFILSAQSAITIDFERGELKSIINNERQMTCGGAPLFTVKLRKKTGVSYVVNATECTFVSFQNNVAAYTCDVFDAQVRFVVQDEALRAKIHIQNKTQDLLEWTELLPFTVPKKLKDEEGGRGEILYPYNEGCRITKMAFRESMPFCYAEPEYPSKGSYAIFPNMIFGQFIAYLDDGAGLYLGMHDKDRTTKHVDFCYFQEGIKVLMRAFCDVNYGQDYAMPFDVVLRAFDGSWHSAADIYYDWFKDNLPVGVKKIKDNPDLPSWYHEYPLIVAYPLRGKHDTDLSSNGLYPYMNAMPYLEEIAKATDSKVMALLMHWEGTAPWAPPYYWPPVGGADEFSSFVKELHARDMLAGLYCSGMGWTQRSNVDKSYRCEDKYRNLKIADCACANSDGEIKSVICTAQRDGVDLCPACDGTKRILKTEFDTICQSGIDYLQALDQNHGGNSYFCYSDKHDHVPAPGKWQQIATNDLLSSIDKNGAVFGCESAAAEPFLGQLLFSDNRYELNYYLGEPIPMYAYVYHEYVNNFMGNQICAMLEKSEHNFTYRMAYSFAAGDMLTLVTNGSGEFLYSWCDGILPKEKNVDKNSAFAFIKAANAWRKGGAGKFLHYGKMIPPVAIRCSKEKIRVEASGAYLTLDSVLSSAFTCEGKSAQFLVNYNQKPVCVSFDKKYDVYTDGNLQNCERGVNEITVEPLSVVMLDLTSEKK
ncbi:MAG: hypothetical protein IJ308_06935 [Clostridia bacterium]|nr:hypothetical protein [Clostridia bacterium]